MFSYHHVALSVLDLDASIAFYGVFGFVPVYRWSSDDGALLIVQLKLDETELELFCFKKSVQQRTLRRPWPQICRVSASSTLALALQTLMPLKRICRH